MMSQTSAIGVVADAATSTVAWSTLAGALGGVLITSVVAFATVILNHRWQSQTIDQQLRQEHFRQLRQERRETYVRYWAAWNRFSQALRSLRNAVQALETVTDPKTQLANQDPDVVEHAWAAELEWREAADALFLIASQAVADAATVHFGVTEQKIVVAWEGGWHADEGGAAYMGLNAAMRADILEPSKF
ncbi:HAMP domain-containing protein [Catenulispora sp. GAS73]|uniref:hypothetical protein n=1 Tax=Catenulispora sp. GAS73 TaxID=3156269 RepID=UPI00351221F7